MDLRLSLGPMTTTRWTIYLASPVNHPCFSSHLQIILVFLQVRQVAEYYSEYKQCFEGAGTNPGEKTLEDKFFEEEVSIVCFGNAMSSKSKYFR